MTEPTREPPTLVNRFVEAARAGDVETLTLLLDAHSNFLRTGFGPYQWTLLHFAAQEGRLAMVDLLLGRGLGPNEREQGDHTYPMHWAAAAGHLEVVRRLIEAGGDVIGLGDDHQLQVIGWATCWDDCDDDRHRAIVDLLISRGARHHLFSAIAMNSADEVRRIVAADPSALSRRMSRHENHQTPLQFAVRKSRPAMVSLLMQLGADPLTADGFGMPVAGYAGSPEVDRPVMAAIAALTLAEVNSADRGNRPTRAASMDLLACLALGDWATAARLVGDDPALVATGGALHLAAKRGDAATVRWLVDRGADLNGRWAHWDAMVTPLHLAAWQGHAEVVRILLGAGGDPTIRDSKHDGDARGWASHAGHGELVAILDQAREANP